MQEDVAGLKGALAVSQQEGVAGKQRYAAAQDHISALQHQLEYLRGERPGLTPRPPREVTTLRHLINNDKV